MARHNILLILYILYCSFFHINLFTEEFSSQFWTGATLLILIWVAIKFKNRGKEYDLLNRDTKKPIYIIMGCVFFSMIIAKYYYGQTLLTSLMAYRVQYLMFGAFSLLIMAPTQKDIYLSLKYFAIVFTIACLLKYYDPELYLTISTTSEVTRGLGMYGGYELCCLLLFFYLQKFKEHPSLRSLIYLSWILVVILLMQNRSTLIPVFIACIYCFLNTKTKWRIGLVIIFSIIFGVVFFSTTEYWQYLYDQTINELNNAKYNRTLAWQYFLLDANKNIIPTIFGNGFISAHTSSIMSTLMGKGIYNSDVGFIGYYNQFGIIPVIVFTYLSLKGILDKSLPLYVRLYGFYILAGSLTIMYFGQDAKIICFIVYYYLLCYYSKIKDQSDYNEIIDWNPLLR